MTPSTAADYRKLASNFYATRLAGEEPTPKRLADALKEAASSYRPGYWRRLRNALAFDQSERGHQTASDRVRATKNPCTMPTSTVPVKAKQKRARAVSGRDESALLDHFRAAGDRESYGAVMVAKITGARPAEMSGVRVEGNQVFVPGAKKSHGGKRGADRVLVVDDREAEMVAACVEHLKTANLGAVQDRLRAAGKKLWPQRTAVPSLYSWRHQLGSELKASGMDRREVAYLMGHQSTASVERYGNRRSARGGKVPRALDRAYESVRELHSEPPPSRSLDLTELSRGVEAVIADRTSQKLQRYMEKTEERQEFGLLQP